jgi:hypothetical protein
MGGLISCWEGLWMLLTPSSAWLNSSRNMQQRAFAHAVLSRVNGPITRTSFKESTTP